MSSIKKTISYLKRNGVIKTYYRIREQFGENKFFADYNETRKKSLATEEELSNQSNTVFKNDYLISIIIPLYNTPEKFLKELLDSIQKQSYENWELILPDGSTTDTVEKLLTDYHDERIVYKRLSENKGISGNTNAGLAMASGEIIAFMDHDDFVEPDALYHIAMAFENGALAAYTDEDKVRENGIDFFLPNYKPDFNYDLLLSNNYICHIFAVDARIAKSVGDIRSEFDGAQDFDFILRCVESIANKTESKKGYGDLKKYIHHINKTLYHWRSSEGSTADNPESKLYAYEAGKRAVMDHLHRRGIHGEVKHTEHLGFYRVEYENIFERPEVGAYVKRREKIKRYTKNDGPFVKNENGELYNPYEGLSIHESGYMHRARMQQDVDSAWREDAIIRDECSEINMDDITDRGYLIVYDPKYN